MMRIHDLVRLVRPWQWVKNVFVFLPLFFSGELLETGLWFSSIMTFFAFSLAASSIYCLNDVIDVAADRMHPVKCHRPIAAGRVSVGVAVTISVALALASLAMTLTIGKGCFNSVSLVILAYLLLNVAYCLKLKQVAIVDVFIVSAGFVLRLVAGGLAGGIWISPWIVCMTFLLSLFLAFAKRRDDLLIYEKNGKAVRKNIMSYNREYLNQTLGILASITMVCYIIYSLSPEVETRMGSRYVYVTSVFVLAGILRYLQLSLVEKNSGSPTRILLSDIFIQLCIAGWIISFVIIIYA